MKKPLLVALAFRAMRAADRVGPAATLQGCAELLQREAVLFCFRTFVVHSTVQRNAAVGERSVPRRSEPNASTATQADLTDPRVLSLRTDLARLRDEGEPRRLRSTRRAVVPGATMLFEAEHTLARLVVRVYRSPRSSAASCTSEAHSRQRCLVLPGH
jgi:hypothetical protein